MFLNPKVFTVKSKVKIFQTLTSPWVYISIPKSHTQELKEFQSRGLVAITATLGSSSWKTSLMPMGDGSHFIPLSKKIRKQESIDLGDNITLSYKLREV